MKRNRATMLNPPPDKKKKKKKSKKDSSSFLNTIQVPLKNSFNLLSEDEDISDKEPAIKRDKIMPVIVTDVDKDLHTIITDLQIDCDIKITSAGNKIFAKTSEDNGKIIAALDSLKINYFSHPNKVNKSFKLILCGLPVVETKDITDSLSATYNITPTKITMFNTNATTKLYLCYFEKSENVDVKTVTAIKSVYHHIISWKKFKPKNRGPTQCYKCCMYGHGISCCKRFAVCMLCSGNHVTKSCTNITRDTINPHFKCFNCLSAKLQHDHKANDLDCPFRAKYIAAIEKARDKNQQRHVSRMTAQNPHATRALNNDGPFLIAPTPPPLTLSFAQAASRAPINIQPNRHNTESSSTNTYQEDANNDLWSISEVTQLLLKSINELKLCKSKLDQLTVIANLLQHACK